jgi:hypothetical protein
MWLLLLMHGCLFMAGRCSGLVLSNCSVGLFRLCFAASACCLIVAHATCSVCWLLWCSAS